MPACIVCEDTITQPLCAACMERSIAAWLQEKLPPQEVFAQLRDETVAIHDERGLTTCIRCNHNMAVCSFCYLDHVKRWLTNTLPELVPEFSMFFGFEMHIEPELPIRGLIAGVV
jgi:hypothetical protein